MNTSISLTLFGVDAELLIAGGTIFALILIYVAGVFLIAQSKQDNSVMDIFYGPAFAVGAWGSVYLLEAVSPITLLLATLVTIWATRLALRIARKNWGQPEDARYAAWREVWSKRGQLYFIARSFLQINLLQGVIIFLVSLPVIMAVRDALGGTSAPVSSLTFIGTIVWLCGFLYETTADWQLDSFIARKKAGTETASLMTTGLFRYSRRPNYFGESLCWLGLALIVLPLPHGYIALISPVLITFIVTRVTGPMLEEIFLKKYPEAYRTYQEETSYFIPWFPKKQRS